MKLTVTKLLAALVLSCVPIPAHAGNPSAPPGLETTADDSLLIVFWNVENFFHPRSESPHRPKYLTWRRFDAKCEAICKTLLEIADAYGRAPDVVAFAEVESPAVTRALVTRTLLRKLGYAAVHFDSPDRRGIDCCLIYRSGRLSLREAFQLPLLDPSGAPLDTRAMLVARFDDLCVIVNHHPSKVGGKSRESLRSAAFAQMRRVSDSLRAENCPAVLCTGDFNDTLWGERPPEECTIKYDGHWEKIDGCFAYGSIRVTERVWQKPPLLEPDKTFGGLKPRRTFTGPRYNGGVSDHLPLIMKVKIVK